MRAFSLTEVVIALGLVAFVLVGILGLFSVGLRSVGDSEMRLEAANLASAIVNQRVAQPTNQLDNFPLARIDLTSLGTNAASAPVNKSFVAAGGQTVSTIAQARFAVATTVWKDTSFSTNSDLVRLRVRLTWPPAATNGLNEYEVLTSFHVSQ